MAACLFGCSRTGQPLPLRISKRRRVNRQFEQCDVVRQVVRKDGGNDMGSPRSSEDRATLDVNGFQFGIESCFLFPDRETKDRIMP